MTTSRYGDWSLVFATKTYEELDEELAYRLERFGRTEVDSSYRVALDHEIARRKYIKEATQNIDPELGFSDLLNVL